MKYRFFSLICIVFFFTNQMAAEDGSLLWLRQSQGANASVEVSAQCTSATLNLAAEELRQSWKGNPVALLIEKDKQLAPDGFRIQCTEKKLVLSSPSATGLLYGAFHLLRLQESGLPIRPSTENPAYSLRILNHWDNMDRTVERGYAGQSLWDWEELPGTLSDRYEAYARANASIGINATVLNNVNASSKILSAEYLEKVKALADIFRPYGIKVYLSINFASPMRAFHSRSFGQRCHRLVEAESQRDLSHHPRLRWLPGESQFRRTARPVRLQPYTCRRCQYAGRCIEAL